MTSLTDFDLFTHQFSYSVEELENNITNLSPKYLVSTQSLTAEFCIKYILDSVVDSGSEDSYIFDKNYILFMQPHITSESFDEAYLAASNK